MPPSASRLKVLSESELFVVIISFYHSEQVIDDRVCRKPFQEFRELSNENVVNI